MKLQKFGPWDIPGSFQNPILSSACPKSFRHYVTNTFHPPTAFNSPNRGSIALGRYLHPPSPYLLAGILKIPIATATTCAWLTRSRMTCWLDASLAGHSPRSMSSQIVLICAPAAFNSFSVAAIWFLALAQPDRKHGQMYPSTELQSAK